MRQPHILADAPAAAVAFSISKHFLFGFDLHFDESVLR